MTEKEHFFFWNKLLETDKKELTQATLIIMSRYQAHQSSK